MLGTQEGVTLPSSRRVRHHVNPLTSAQQQPIVLPEWGEHYDDLSRPFWIDLGCATGEFILEMGTAQPEWNYLGLEIRKPLVEGALKRRDEAGLTNVHYVYANILVHLDAVLASLPQGSVRQLSLLFPDPHLKRRKHKWRQLQPSVLNVMARHLPAGAELYFATDVAELYADTLEILDAHPAFRLTDRPLHNPFPIDSEREVHSRLWGRSVYRAVYTLDPSSPPPSGDAAGEAAD